MALRNAFADLALESKQDTANTHLATIAGKTPLTDTELRASALAISGTVTAIVANGLDVDVLSLPALPAGSNAIGSVSVSNFPATQPVSGTVAISGTVPVSGPLTDTQLRAAALPVSIASMPSTPVTGTFWQATQPVSGPLTNAELRAAAVPVSGTFFQATQPVSLAALPALAAGSAAIGTVGVTSLPALAAGTNTIGTTLAPALTKGTQGTTGYTVQNLKDAGRTLFSAATLITGVTAVTTEALLTMVPTRAGVAAATATTIAASTGKTLRITRVTVGFISTAAAVLSMRFALRINPTAAVVAASPILQIFPLSSAAAVAQQGNEMTIEFPDGLEISGTQNIGITQIGSVATGTVWASITGFEY